MVRSLRRKLSLTLVLLLFALMTVVSVLLINRVARFHADDFYQQMQVVFSDEQFYSDLQHAAASDQGAERLEQILEGNAGMLGVDGLSRNYFILDGRTGVCLAGSDEELGKTLQMTPNILTAIAGQEGYAHAASSGYLDVAMPIASGGNAYIIYLLDNRQTAQDLNHALLLVLLESLAIGLVITLLLGVLLSGAIVPPVHRLTDAANRVASGDFSQTLPVSAQDEIGALTAAFNRMTESLRTAQDAGGDPEHGQGSLPRTATDGPPRALVEQASYELRAPLANVRNYVELLRSDSAMPGPRREQLLSAIEKETERMSSTAKALLELSKVDAKADTLQYSWFPFANVILSVYQANLMDAVRRGHTVHLEIPNDLPMLHADRARIEQVVTLVLAGAIKRTPNGGEITISAGHGGSAVWMNVSDNSSGGPMKGLGRVLDRIARGERPPSPEDDQAGLEAAKELIAAHGGSLQWSDRLPKGCTVRLSLPVETSRREGDRRGG